MVVLAYSAFSAMPRRIALKRLGWGAASGIAISITIVVASPTLRAPGAIAIWEARLGVDAAKFAPAIEVASASGAEALGMSQSEINASTAKADTTTDIRFTALKRFLAVAWRHHWLGVGTGFGFQTNVGPHNTFASLAAENGFPAAAAFMAVLALLTMIAIIRRSPALFAVVGVVIADAMVSHTVLIEPDLLIIVAMTLGATALPRSTR